MRHREDIAKNFKFGMEVAPIIEVKISCSINNSYCGYLVMSSQNAKF